MNQSKAAPQVTPSVMAWDEPAPAPSVPANTGEPSVFRADLDVAEVDERYQAGPAWTARAEGLSRAQLLFRSRSLVYPGRRLLVAVHLIDGEPVGLIGRVNTCEYEGEGQHRVTLSLEPLPKDQKIAAWLHSRVNRRR